MLFHNCGVHLAIALEFPIFPLFPGNWQALLEVACYRLQDHPALSDREILEQDKVAKGDLDTCQKHVWDKKALSQD